MATHYQWSFVMLKFIDIVQFIAVRICEMYSGWLESFCTKSARSTKSDTWSIQAAINLFLWTLGNRFTLGLSRSHIFHVLLIEHSTNGGKNKSILSSDPHNKASLKMLSIYRTATSAKQSYTKFFVEKWTANIYVIWMPKKKPNLFNEEWWKAREKCVRYKLEWEKDEHCHWLIWNITF